MIEIINEDSVVNVSRKSEYDSYLTNHINGVKRSWNEILMPSLLDKEDFSLDTLTRIGMIINSHDKSKYSNEEYSAYLEYFYPSDGSQRDFDNVPDDVEINFDKAWLHPQKCNPPHWQYWVLIRDSGELVPADMSLESIFEMLCDWHSFTLRDPESTAYKWYQDNKSKMVLSDTTKMLVEKYVDYMKEPLKKVGD